MKAGQKSDNTLSFEANRLLHSIRFANTMVYRTAETKKNYQGMGTTLSAVYFTDEMFVVANVGDSPIYRVHSDTITLLSTPHTVETEYHMKGGTMIGSRFRHMLTRSMGNDSEIKPDLIELPYFKGDIIVICSDGLSDKIKSDEIKTVVTTMSAYSACQKLVDLANNRGGDDNITVIVLKIQRNNINSLGFTGKFVKIKNAIFGNV